MLSYGADRCTCCGVATVWKYQLGGDLLWTYDTGDANATHCFERGLFLFVVSTTKITKLSAATGAVVASVNLPTFSGYAEDYRVAVSPTGFVLPTKVILGTTSVRTYTKFDFDLNVVWTTNTTFADGGILYINGQWVVTTRTFSLGFPSGGGISVLADTDGSISASNLSTTVAAGVVEAITASGHSVLLTARLSPLVPRIKIRAETFDLTTISSPVIPRDYTGGPITPTRAQIVGGDYITGGGSDMRIFRWTLPIGYPAIMDANNWTPLPTLTFLTTETIRYDAWYTLDQVYWLLAPSFFPGGRRVEVKDTGDNLIWSSNQGPSQRVINVLLTSSSAYAVGNRSPL